MAKRRMFSLEVVDTDSFNDMPVSTRLLYYELCLRADDDGFVSNPKKIVKMCGCTEDDLKVLITKSYIIPFESGVIVILHWKIHNYIQKDRYKETLYINEKSYLIIDENGAYKLLESTLDTKRIQNGYTGKVSKELEKEIDKGNRHIYPCHLNKESKDSFCFGCHKKSVCDKKTDDKFIKIYGKTFEEYLKTKDEPVHIEVYEYDWLNESEDD